MKIQTLKGSPRTLQTLRGFRDFLPADAIKRQYVINKIKEVFERFGFDPLETPALEYAQTLLGKYGDEADKLLYLFEDRGGRKVGLRYDQTVPASRVVAQYQQQLPTPFKRYQIQPVWRAENPQKGRFREFLQCDADIFGSASTRADAEVIALVSATLGALGVPRFRILLNDRALFADAPLAAITIIDKLKKIGEDGVKRELEGKGFDSLLLTSIRANEPSPRLAEIIENAVTLGVKRASLVFTPTLARGLDYYTRTIFEVEVEGYDTGAVCGGGRYDNLIGQFTGSDVPAVGFAFGFDRLLEALDRLNLLPGGSTATNVLVTVFSNDHLTDSLSLVSQLRASGINAEVSLDADKLDKQLKYADRKGIPYVIIQGPEEVSKGVVKLKDMKAKMQEELTIEEVITKISSN